MRVVPCLHPKVITNPYTSEEVVVPCGHCAVCNNIKAARWVTRLDEESRCHKYTLFATLQYNEQNVPQVVRLRKENLIHPDDIIYYDSETFETYDFYDKSIKRHTKKDLDFCRETKVLNVLSKYDIQKFIKRVRYYARKYDPEFGFIRYWCTGEYGPQTFRPHYHLILWFDSPIICDRIEEILLDCWRFGNVYDPHLVHGKSASEYVASYVNCVTNLPSILQHNKLKPFHLQSSSPAIGTLSFNESDFRKILDGGLTKTTLYSVSKQEFIDVPLWRCVRDRLFPKIPYFDNLSHGDRVSLYRIFKDKDFECSEAAARWLQNYYVKSHRDQWQERYFKHISYHDKRKVVYHWSTKGGITYKRDVIFEKKFFFSALVRFHRICRRVALNACRFGLTIDDYVTKIELYYDNYDRELRENYYKFQDKYFNDHPDEKHALYFDFAFVDRVNDKVASSLSPSDRYYLDCAGLLPSEPFARVHLDISDCFDYKDMKSTHEHIVHENTKVKKQNDYLFAHSDKFQNIINFQNID